MCLLCTYYVFSTAPGLEWVTVNKSSKHILGNSWATWQGGIWSFSSVQSLSRVRVFVTPWTAAHQASLSITNSWSLLKLMAIELVMPSNHLILVSPFFSCLQSFPVSGSFQMSQFFTSGGQSIGVSASTSVLPMNIQDWSPLDLLAVQGTLKSLQHRS